MIASALLLRLAITPLAVTIVAVAGLAEVGRWRRRDVLRRWAASGPVRAGRSTRIVEGASAPFTARRHRRRVRELDASAAPWLGGIARELRAGSSLAVAVIAAAAAVGGRLGAEVVAVSGAIDREGVGPAVSRWAAATGSEVLAGVGTTVALGASLGGELAPAFAAAEEAVRDRAALVDEVASLTASARASATLLGALPIAAVVLGALVDDRAIRFLIGTTGGRVCAGVAVALALAGRRWMRVLIEGVV